MLVLISFDAGMNEAGNWGADRIVALASRLSDVLVIHVGAVFPTSSEAFTNPFTSSEDCK